MLPSDPYKIDVTDEHPDDDGTPPDPLKNNFFPDAAGDQAAAALGAPRQRVNVNHSLHDNARGFALTVSISSNKDRPGIRNAHWTLDGDGVNLPGYADHTPRLGMQVTPSNPNGAQSRHFINYLQLGKVSGNIFTVSAEKSNRWRKGGKVVSLAVETWKQITVYCSATASYADVVAEMMAPVRAEFARANIDILWKPELINFGVDEILSLNTIEKMMHDGRIVAPNCEEPQWFRVMFMKQFRDQVENAVWEPQIDHLALLAGDLNNKVAIRMELDVAKYNYFECDKASLCGESRYQLAVRPPANLESSSVNIIISVNIAAPIAAEYFLVLELGANKFKSEPVKIKAALPVSQQFDFKFDNSLGQILLNALSDLHTTYTVVTQRALGELARGLGWTCECADGRLTWSISRANWPAHIDVRAGETLRLRLEGKTMVQYQGHQKGRNLAVSVGLLQEKFGLAYRKALSNAVVHEIVHVIGGVSKAHPHYYGMEHGGVASGDVAHCWTGSVPKEASDCILPGRAALVAGAKAGEYLPCTPVPGEKGHCTMYHKAIPGYYEHAELCQECLKHLRQLDMGQALWKGKPK